MALKLDPLAYPPRGMSRAVAARYIGVSTTKFDELVSDGRMPPPVRIDSRAIWDRIKIDLAFSDLDQRQATDCDESGLSHTERWIRANEAPLRTASQPSRFAKWQGEKGPSGWVLPQAPGDAIDQWYSRLGFDPATMTQADMERLQYEAKERWKAHLVGTPLGKRERDALRQFVSFEPGRLVHHAQITGCGIDTGERLETRGYIEVRYVSDDPTRLEGWVLTEDGKAAAQAVAAGSDPVKRGPRSA